MKGGSCYVEEWLFVAILTGQNLCICLLRHKYVVFVFTCRLSGKVLSRLRSSFYG